MNDHNWMEILYNLNERDNETMTVGTHKGIQLVGLVRLKRMTNYKAYADV